MKCDDSGRSKVDDRRTATGKVRPSNATDLGYRNKLSCQIRNLFRQSLAIMDALYKYRADRSRLRATNAAHGELEDHLGLRPLI